MKSFFATYLLNCYNVRFAYDLQNCKNILFGVALRNKEYIFKNKQYTKEEREAIFLTYSKKIKTISGLQEVLAEYQEFKNTCPHECTHNLNEEKSRGTQINNSNGIILSFGTEKSHDCRYCGNEGFAQNVMDVDLCSFSQLSYNSIGSTKTYGCACMGSNFGEIRDSYYGFYTRGGNNLLGCFGVQNKSYYILNKEYPKEERENLAQQIIQELIDKEARGKFFATELSPFPYNDTQANKFFPIRQLKI